MSPSCPFAVTSHYQPGMVVQLFSLHGPCLGNWDFPWGAADRGQSQIEVEREKGQCPAGILRYSPCLSPSGSPGLTPPPLPSWRAPGPGRPLHGILCTLVFGLPITCVLVLWEEGIAVGKQSQRSPRPALAWVTGTQARRAAAGVGLRPPGARKGSE